MTPTLPVTPPPASTHPYAVRFELTLGSNVELSFVEDEARVAFGTADVLVIKKIRELPFHMTLVSLDVEAFCSAANAERAGQLLAFSLMWLAVSKRVTVGFAKWTGGWPFAVRDRTRSDGFTSRGEGRGYVRLDPADLSAEVARAYEKRLVQSEALLTSMQFYASARLEASEVSRFIGVMTALEALAEQEEYGAPVETVLLELACQVEKDPRLSDTSMDAVRNSLAGQIRLLKRESVGKAIRRLVKAHIDDKETQKFVDESYAVRSKILHEGMRVPDLGPRTFRLEDVVRAIYASKTGLDLSRP